MHPRSVEELIEERVAKLAAIARRRNVLLREMHQMICRRRNIGSILPLDEDEKDLNKFILRFQMTEDDVETGSICHLDDQAIPLAPSPQSQALSLSKRTSGRLVHGTTSPKPQECPPTLSPSERMKSRHLSRETTEFIMADASTIPSLPKEADDSDDELNLFKKSPPRLVEPKHRPLRDHIMTTALEPQPNAVKLVVEEGSHIPPITSEMEPGIDAPVPGPSQVSRQVFPTTLVTSGDSWNVRLGQFEEALPQKAIASVSPAAAHKSGDPALLSNAHVASFPAIPTPSRKTIVVTSLPSAAPEPDYTFPGAPSPQPITPIPKDLPQRLHQFQSEFTLPPLKSLNPDYKKSKSLKRRREKEREAGFKEGRKDDWGPMGLNKWAAIVNANPVWKKVARASKCLTTREWVVAMAELRLVRAIDRIELLKREGRWSFRQPKKQRAIGGVPKTHWDYLMDEMRWMRVDFREERRWKLALAYNISADVLDWHAAGTKEVRVAKGICVRWKRGCPEEPQNEMVVDHDVNLDHSADHAKTEVDIEEIQPNEGMSLLGVDYGSEDEDEDEDNDEDADHESRNVTDALEPRTLIASILEDADAKDDPIDAQVLQPKTEEIEDLSALIKFEPINDAGINQRSMILDDIKPDTSGLKLTSHDPVLAFQPTPSSNGGDTDTSPGSLKQGKSNIYAPFREIIAYSEDNKLFLDLEEFDVSKFDVPLKTVKEAAPSPPGLESIFPDLHILDFDLTPVVQSVEGRKRPERKIDRDDPNKRPDDILSTKLYPTGDFMTSKPTLIGPLRPSRNWKGGQWLSLDDSAVVPESDFPVKNDDSVSDLFDGRFNSGPSLIALQLQTAFMKDKELRKRSDHLWSNVDDSLLKSLCDRYPNNWALISECFNASRLTVPTDKRTLRDCLDRWREKWGPEGRRMLETSSAAEATPPPTSQMTTRGVKRLASASISSVSPSGMPAGSEPRKKRRHALVLETIRKAGKKRAEALQKAQSQRKTSGVHETHVQYSKLPKRTPAELSRVKADKEALALQELQTRKRQEEIARLNRMPNGQGPLQTVPQQASQSQLQSQAAPVMQRPPGTSMPAQVVPQIRNQVNISQQQRTSTPAMQTGRLTQQQLLQAQARAAQQQVLAHAQNHIQTNGVNGNVSGTNSHLSPSSYVNRDVALSGSPPHNSAVTSAVNSPRPPSAQAQAHPMPLQVPGNAGSRGTYYLPNLSSVQGYTTEQLQTALRLTQQQAQGFTNPS
ncbi:hypothetical protein H2248_009593 [Termitomyces sp. 'cryptogamus']|nr:hypothetical protein H2248_009593 [Termitomyces sp. 'cryptogamus']